MKNDKKKSTLGTGIPKGAKTNTYGKSIAQNQGKGKRKNNYQNLGCEIWIGALLATIIVAAIVVSLVKSRKPKEIMPEPTATTVSVEQVELPTYLAHIESEVVEEPTTVNLGQYTVTAYCGCEECCGRWAENRKDKKVIGAAGVELKPSHSVAADLPLGTAIFVDGICYTVEDRTSRAVSNYYGSKVIDIYFETHEQALAFGKHKSEVYLLKEGE